MLRFVGRAENALSVGGPGVGKSHLAVALGAEAAKAGREVGFMDCARLVDDLKDAQSREISKKRPRHCAHSKLPMIDELGHPGVDGGADLLFQLVSTRCGQRSIIITANAGIGGWAKVLGDGVAASTIADRACHHCRMIKMTGRSYRLKDLPAGKGGYWPDGIGAG